MFAKILVLNEHLSGPQIRYVLGIKSNIYVYSMQHITMHIFNVASRVVPKYRCSKRKLEYILLVELLLYALDNLQYSSALGNDWVLA